MNGERDNEVDAEPVDNRCSGTGGPRRQISNNRISNAELYNNHPHYPMTADQCPVEPIDLVHFVFVYAPEDYGKFKEFIAWFRGIAGTILNGSNIKIEMYDSQVFPPSHDDNVHDICERTMFILPFLTKHYCTNGHLRFFLSEGIGRTRLDLTPNSGRVSDIMKKQKKYAIRPVLTADPRAGEYHIPTGLTMIRGIDYYNHDKEYVKDQLTEIIKEAMRKFNERKHVMDNALTGRDKFLDNFDEEFERTHGPPPTEAKYEAFLQQESGAGLFHDGNLPIQEYGDGALNLPVTSLDVLGYAEGINMTDTPENNQGYDATSSPLDLSLTPTVKTAEEDAGRPSLEGISNNVSSSESSQEVSLEIDNGTFPKDQANITSGPTAINQDLAEDGLKSGSRLEVSNDPGGEGEHNDQLVVQNTAAASASEGGHKQVNGKQTEGKPKKQNKKSGETVIVISNCNVVQIGEKTAIFTSKRKQDARRNLQGDYVINEDTSNGLSSSESNGEMTWNNLSSAEGGREDTETKEIENSDSDNESGLMPDNIPSYFSGNLTATPQNPTNTLQGMQDVDDFSGNLEDAISDEDSFLDEHLNDPNLESLPEYKEDQGAAAVQGNCVTNCHVRVLSLCKNSRKTSSMSMDSGYLSHMQFSNTSDVVPYRGLGNTDDDVD